MAPVVVINEPRVFNIDSIAQSLQTYTNLGTVLGNGPIMSNIFMKFSEDKSCSDTWFLIHG